MDVRVITFYFKVSEPIEKTLFTATELGMDVMQRLNKPAGPPCLQLLEHYYVDGVACRGGILGQKFSGHIEDILLRALLVRYA